MKSGQNHSESLKAWRHRTMVILAILFQAQYGWAQDDTSARSNGLAMELRAGGKPPYGSRGVRVHDPSTIIQCGGEFWVFYTGRGIPCYHSKDLKDWVAGPRVFTNAPEWAAPAVPGQRGNYFWAPDIISVGGRYLLYYAVSTFGKNISAIGLATNPTLDPTSPRFQWTDEGLVVESHNTNDFNAIDPAVSQDADGRLWLAFGSFWRGIKLVELDPKTGKRRAEDSPLYSLAENNSIEASYIYRHDDHYYLFVNWGLCCRGTNSTYEIRVGRSGKITGPYLDAAGVNMLNEGGSEFLKGSGSFIGPGHAGIISDGGADWFSCHFYDGTRAGAPTLAILPLRWDSRGWPEIVPEDAGGNGKNQYDGERN